MLAFRRLPASPKASLSALRLALFAVPTVALLGVAEPARACSFASGTPTTLRPSNPFSGVPAAAGGRFQTLLRVPVNLFALTNQTQCAVGLGLGQTGQLPPNGVNVDRAFVTRLNSQTGQQTILAEFFPLNLSSVTSNGLTNGSGQLFPGAKWFGFTGRIQPFTVPLLRSGEIFTLVFVVSYPPGQQNQLINLKTQFAAGEAEPDGFPDYFGSRRVTFFGPGQLGKCLPTQNVLCLNGSRFRVDLKWRNTATGALRPAKITGTPTEASGLFFFSDPNTFDATVKVLNACSNNNRYWVFASAATDVQYTLTVTDTQANRTKTYTNPLNQPAKAVVDTNAFATCP
jgi:hypothetical protein